ncbi:acyltransferase family protein [Zhihengliuella flava]|uniref:Peptidoglycan/LPS O-acetylase OafA/YrhL n=1 Tax=Zhihengliuella flava TaxID=1285193 RepID=A0A931GMJ1_9MICC|nr:acyltransferase family protein [Zhihengliuella flava]MBG6085474.1 peptidoglycan/LPS O-acetylase OafA/YrhL [Zhihengliuella flava]
MSASHSVEKPAFRPEIQGLRAFAVLMVVFYHVWLGRVSGGVDVFLLVSAFLLTVSFLYKVESGRPLALVHYWLNRLRGLLPAAIVVLLAVVGATVSLLPRTRWEEVAEQTVSSLFYFQNWQLASDSVDYYAANQAAASPLQHFWSLSIQGQVFVLWPLIIAAAAAIWHLIRQSRPDLGFRPVLAVTFGLVFAASFVYSVYITATRQAWAYFDTGARLWEFALGSLLVLALPYVEKAPVALRVVMGWVGMIAMLSCGLVLTVQGSFPGYVALWPTLAAALIIGAGQTGSRYGVDRLLSSQPLASLGSISYALYLWHWPILVIYLIHSGHDAAGWLSGTAIIAVSLLLAWATTRMVETPFHSWRWPTQRRRRLSIVVAALMAAVLLPLNGWQEKVEAFEEAAAAQSPQDNPGAAALADGYVPSIDPAAATLPLSTTLDQEWASVGGTCDDERRPADEAIRFCRQYGDPATAEKTIVLLGDSHAQHWSTALHPAAEQNNWAWILIHEPACRYGTPGPERTESCNNFLTAAQSYVLEQQPDAVFTVASKTATHPTDELTPGDQERVADGYVEAVTPFTDAGIQVVGLRDTPRYSYSVPECVDVRGGEECSLDQDYVLAPENPLDELQTQVEAGELPSELSFFDMTDQFCVDGRCRAVIGNVITIRDEDHVTRTYAQTLAPVFERRLRDALGW